MWDYVGSILRTPHLTGHQLDSDGSCLSEKELDSSHGCLFVFEGGAAGDQI